MTASDEFVPAPQTLRQQQVEARVTELTEIASHKLGMTRRRFLKTSGGMAAAFLAMNEVFGPFFKVDAAELFESAAYAQNTLPADLFVVDDHLHMVRSDIVVPGAMTTRARAQGPTSGWPRNPSNPNDDLDELGGVWTPYHAGIIGLPIEPANFQLVQFIKDVFLDSQVAVGVLTNIAGAGGMAPEYGPREPRNIDEAIRAEPLSAGQTAAVRTFVNDLAGSRRLMAHGILYPGRINLPYMEYQIENYQPDSWKGYNSSASAKASDDPDAPFHRWRHDDEDVAYPTFELISRYQAMYGASRAGFGTICVHKGLAAGQPSLPENGHPSDYPKVSRDWPNLTFVAYHSCMQNTWGPPVLAGILNGQTREGVPDIPWTTEFAQTVQDLPNVYGDIGAVFGATVITFPTVAAHMLGQLVKYLGPNRLNFGTDAIWHGAPHWQIEALWRFQIPAEMRAQYGYPELTEQVKRQILGLNSARIYRLDRDPRAYEPVPPDYEAHIPDHLKRTLGFPPPGAGADRLTQIRDAYVEFGEDPSLMPAGWVNAAKEG
jgi:predicted TIM-barrel fold metal-dependent hydrolase